MGNKDEATKEMEALKHLPKIGEGLKLAMHLASSPLETADGMWSLTISSRNGLRQRRLFLMEAEQWDAPQAISAVSGLPMQFADSSPNPASAAEVRGSIDCRGSSSALRRISALHCIGCRKP